VNYSVTESGLTVASGEDDKAAMLIAVLLELDETFSDEDAIQAIRTAANTDYTTAANALRYAIRMRWIAESKRY